MCAMPSTLGHAGQSRPSRDGRRLDPAAWRGEGRRLPVQRALGLLLIAALLGGCALAPPKGAPGAAGRDGPEANPPPDLAARPDAEPKLEPIRVGGPNKPYVVLGRGYVPMTQDRPFSERGLASWYGRKFQGRPTSSGEPYDMYAMTAAHPTLPIPSYAWVRNPANGRAVVVRVNDRGPFHPGRVIDLSYTAALKLDLLRGVAPVEVERITFDAIRTGAWRREDGTEVATAGSALPVGGAAAAVASAGRAASVAAADDPSAAAASGPTAAPTPTAAAEAARTPSPTAVVAAPTGSGAGSDAGTTAETITAARAPPPAAPATVAMSGVPAAANPPGAASASMQGFWVQLGAFRERSGATTFRRRVASELSWLTPLLAVFDDAALYRLQAGPYPSRDLAFEAAETIRSALQLVPVIVERR